MRKTKSFNANLNLICVIFTMIESNISTAPIIMRSSAESVSKSFTTQISVSSSTYTKSKKWRSFRSKTWVSTNNSLARSKKESPGSTIPNLWTTRTLFSKTNKNNTCKRKNPPKIQCKKHFSQLMPSPKCPLTQLKLKKLAKTRWWRTSHHTVTRRILPLRRESWTRRKNRNWNGICSWWATMMTRISKMTSMLKR